MRSVFTAVDLHVAIEICFVLLSSYKICRTVVNNQNVPKCS